jgi:hypothetical protein
MSEYVIKGSCEECPFHTCFSSEDCVHPDVVSEKTPYFDGIGYREFSSDDREYIYARGMGIKHDHYPPVPSWCPWLKEKTLTLVFEEENDNKPGTNEEAFGDEEE